MAEGVGLRIEQSVLTWKAQITNVQEGLCL